MSFVIQLDPPSMIEMNRVSIKDATKTATVFDMRLFQLGQVTLWTSSL